MHFFDIHQNSSSVRIVHPYQNLKFWIIDEINHLLKKFILFNSIETCTSLIFIIKVHLLQKFKIVYPYQNLQFWIIDEIHHLLQKFNLFNSIETCTSLIFIKKVHLLQKVNLFTHIKTCNFETLMKFIICYKSSICSPI